MNTEAEIKGLMRSPALGMRALAGAGIGLVLITVFLLKAGEPNPAWPKFYWIKPVVIVPLAGIAGGLFYHAMDYLRNRGGALKVLGYVVGIIGFIVALWLGSVLGLNGTYWN